ncbi:MAG TPA: hypothetical protein VFI73_14790 [Candidatus Nitrosopolaris sp.]|nr:hypothetical protein [Candidatus Nitrosopolaris sp.]
MGAERSARFHYYGIAQFEIEVIYSALKGVFGSVDELQLPIEDIQYVSMVEIEFPIPFGESFFQIFTVERWYKIKGLIKEMKRRRGSRRGVKAFISFSGITPAELKPRLIFSLMSKNNRHFEMAIEKIEYLVDIIPIQMQNFPATGNNMEEIVYHYDELNFKWDPYSAKDSDGSEYYYLRKTNELKRR